MTLLMVVGELNLATFLARGLKECAHAVTQTRTPYEARSALAASNYDAIIVDGEMWDADVKDLLHRRRASGVNNPVLVLGTRNATRPRP